jgi:hypothetical protein
MSFMGAYATAEFSLSAATELARITGEDDPDASSRRQRANDKSLDNPSLARMLLLGPAAMPALAMLQPKPGTSAPDPRAAAPQQRQGFNGPAPGGRNLA